MSVKYYKDVDKCRIVRTVQDSFRMEYIFEGASEWIKTEHDHPYEREHWLGEGNCCLYDISEEEAAKVILSWTANWGK